MWNKGLIALWLFLLPVCAFTQGAQSVEKKWQEIRKKNGYEASDKYRGPTKNPYGYPTTINESQQQTQGSPNISQKPYNGVPLTNRQIQRGRSTPSNPNGPGGGGTTQSDPEIEPAEEWESPEIESDDNDPLELNSPSENFWLTLGIVLLVVLLAFIIYQLIKNKTPHDAVVPFEPLAEDLNPATISKTELELRLEEAMRNEDYRECVRIYFLFAMKNLIERRWIFWKKERTNMHYIIEMQGRPGAYDFEQIVNLYDLVWYGDYELDKSAYANIQPELERHYLTIERLK
jgi:hypothetical protein